MAKVRQIQVGNETRDIATTSEYVDYSNVSLTGVANVKGAIDYLVANQGSGGSGGGSSTSEASTPRYHNNPIPYWKDSVKVLCIANSYTMYSMSHIHDILNGLGIEDGKVVFQVAHYPARMMSTWRDYLRTDGSFSQLHSISCNNNIWKKSYYQPTNGIRTIVRNTPWDIILFQPYPPTGNSDNASSYSSYAKVLNDCIKEVRMVCPNPKVCIAMNMIWSNSQTYSTYASVWSSICNAVKQTISDGGVDVIVPTGTAFINAINTATFTGHNNLMVDSTGHPGAGVARYIASCCLYETLLAPVLGASMFGLTNVPTFTATDNAQYANGEIAVSAQNIALCQKAAMSAICDMFSIDTALDPITNS